MFRKLRKLFGRKTSAKINTKILGTEVTPIVLKQRMEMIGRSNRLNNRISRITRRPRLKIVK